MRPLLGHIIWDSPDGSPRLPTMVTQRAFASQPNGYARDVRLGSKGEMRRPLSGGRLPGEKRTPDRVIAGLSVRTPGRRGFIWAGVWSWRGVSPIVDG